MVVEDKNVPDSVQVAVRIRPLVDSEIQRGCDPCLQSFPEASQIRIKDFGFTYNYVFPPEVGQRPFYETAVSNLVTKLFKGYNVTILAYGQTGSGKTYSMGTAYSGESSESYDAGIIPQAVNDIFEFIDTHNEEYDFKVSVSFIELYQEQVYDLLSSKSRNQNVIDIREDSRGILLPGLTEEKVFSVSETMNHLMKGSSGRATGATAMNLVSSRSHAIFTVYIVQESKTDKNLTTTSKFHLVDLAGSERSKKTKATGDRFKEGVKINQGLLALGNVISALGDGTNRGFICYRESKLTRLLQDSLGGNSVTLMIACVSPADYNLEETLSTLRYADRARRIKNKPIVNQDARAAEIIKLNNLVQQLRLQIVGQGGAIPQDQSHLVEELQKVKSEYADLKQRYNVLAEKNKNLNNLLQRSLSEHTNMFEKVLNAEAAKDKVERKLDEITEEFNQTINNLSKLSTSTKEDALTSICEMRTKIIDLTTEHKQCGQLISDIIHENSEDVENNGEGEEEYITCKSAPDFSDTDFNEKQEAHTAEQVSRNKQFKHLIDSLKLKESLAEKLSENNINLNTCNENVKEFQMKIEKLESEKETLQHQLKIKAKLDPKVVSESKNKIQELESQINMLRKKCQNQENLIKMKEKNDLKITSLRNEIQQIKAAKVKLLHSMKAENNKFRNWKSQKEKQLAKLTDQDRKRQTEMVRMENRHAKQQNVLKRKLEEAVAASKRLKEASERHKNAQKHRNVQNSGKMENIQNWVEQELELMGSLVAAQRTLEGLMEDRGVLTTELEELKKNDPNNKKSITQLQEEIQLRSAQIADMQQKILDSDQENKSKMKWDTVQSMVEAKCALKYLFDVAAETKREIQNNIYKNNNVASKYEELLESQKEMEERLRDRENAIKKKEYQHKKAMSQIEKNFEEKVYTLTKQLNAQFAEKLDSSENDEENGTGTSLIVQLYEKTKKENEQLREENEELFHQLENTDLKGKFRRREGGRSYNNPDDSFDEKDNQNNDPDWRNTPMMKRIASRIKPQEPQPVKRTSDGQTKCSCKGNCVRKMCGCRKLNVRCGSKCKCDHDTCKNKEGTFSDSQFESTTDSSALMTETDMDENVSRNSGPDNRTFKIPKLESEGCDRDSGSDNFNYQKRNLESENIIFKIPKSESENSDRDSASDNFTFKVPKLKSDSSITPESPFKIRRFLNPEDAENNMNLTNSARKRSFFYNNDIDDL